MMVRKIIRLTDMLVLKEAIKREDRKLIIHGLIMGMELVFNIFTTVALGIIFGYVIESLVFLLSFSFIRIYAGGYHCQRATSCYFFSSGIVVATLTLVQFTPTKYMFGASVVIVVIAAYMILKFAPIGAKHKPLDKDEQKYFRKKAVLHLLVDILLFGLLFLLRLHRFGFVVSLGVGMSGMLVCLGRKTN